jgi:hypothetical protein
MFIYEAFPHDKQGNRTVGAMLSENIEALEPEHQNFRRIAKCENNRKLFAKIHDYLKTANPKRDRRISLWNAEKKTREALYARMVR